MSSADLPQSSTRESVAHQAMEEAAHWYALLRSGEAGAADRAAWQTWLAASEAHGRAWAFVERVSRRFEPIQASADPRRTLGVLQATQQQARRRRALLGTLAFGGTGLLGWVAWRHTPLPIMAKAWTADHHTGVGERRELVLSDGTRVWLGSASAFNEDYQADLRRLRLVSGDIFVDTAADASRPLVVDTPHGRLRALGTRFAVRLEGDAQTFVAVYQGAVELLTGDKHQHSRHIVRAHEQTRFSASRIESIAAAEAAHEAWIRGVLIAQNMPLGQVVQELARYRRGHLAVDPAVAELRVFGSFPLDDTDRALSMLAAVLPIQVRQPLPWWRSIEPARRQAQPR